MENMDKIDTVHKYCKDDVQELVDETPDVIIDPMLKTKDEEEMRRSIFALFMTFLTFLFCEGKIILKRKDKDGKDRCDKVR